MGYGKHRDVIKELVRRAGAFTEVTTAGLKNPMAFYRVVQLEVGLGGDRWWLGLHLDKDGWLEQNNLIEKVARSDDYMEQLVELYAELDQDDFYMDFYSNQNELPYVEVSNAYDWIGAMQQFKEEGLQYSMFIRKEHECDDCNYKEILSYLKVEFAKLLPIYKFMSWHPKTNNYIDLL